MFYSDYDTCDKLSMRGTLCYVGDTGGEADAVLVPVGAAGLHHYPARGRRRARLHAAQTSRGMPPTFTLQ